MLVTLLVWAWLQRVHSSRQIERLCSRDVAFRLICAGDAPDHVTIARFRQGFAVGVEQLFEQVLLLAQRLGLGQLGVVALDGTKIASPASAGQNRTADGLVKAAEADRQREAARQAARDAARAHAATDEAEDARFGEGHGDVMPDDPATGDPTTGDPGVGRGGVGGGPGRSRSARIAEALADLTEQARREEAEQQGRAAERQARSTAKGGPVPGRPPAGQEVVLAEQALAATRAAAQDRMTAWQRTGRGSRPPEVDSHWLVRKAAARLARAHQLVAARAAHRPKRDRTREPVRNITDPQSRLQPTAGGWLQGYNAQAVTDSDGLIWAAEVSNNPSDRAVFVPMVQAAAAMADRVGARPVGLVLADAGYLSIDNLTAAGPDRLIAVGKHRTLEAAASTAQRDHDRGEGEAVIAAMRTRLATPDGIAAYRQRGRIAETTFGHGKHNLSFRCFTGIGLERARTEWRFHAAVHNLSKIINRGLLPAWQTG